MALKRTKLSVPLSKATIRKIEFYRRDLLCIHKTCSATNCFRPTTQCPHRQFRRAACAPSALHIPLGDGGRTNVVIIIYMHARNTFVPLAKPNRTTIVIRTIYWLP